MVIDYAQAILHKSIKLMTHTMDNLSGCEVIPIIVVPIMDIFLIS